MSSCQCPRCASYVSSLNKLLAILPKLMQYNLYQISNGLFAEMDKLILKFIWTCKRSPKSKKGLEKKSKVEGLTLLDFKTSDKAPVIKTVWYWHRDSIKINGLELRVNFSHDFMAN